MADWHLLYGLIYHESKSVNVTKTAAVIKKRKKHTMLTTLPWASASGYAAKDATHVIDPLIRASQRYYPLDTSDIIPLVIPLMVIP